MRKCYRAQNWFQEGIPVCIALEENPENRRDVSGTTTAEIFILPVQPSL
jgi:hypothetical protein